MGGCNGNQREISIDDYMKSKFSLYRLAYHPQKLKVDKTNFELNRKVSRLL